jgi:hypothetical protein
VGGAGRGGRRESWAPPDRRLCSSHRASVYGVPISTRARLPGRRRISFRPPLPHRPHLRVGAGFEKFSRTHRTSALLSSSPRAASPRGNLMEEGMGVPARGGRRQSWAPPDIGSAHPAERAFTVYTISTWARSPGRRRTSFRPPLPHRPHLRVGPGFEKFSRTHRTSALLSSSPERPAHGEI